MSNLAAYDWNYSYSCLSFYFLVIVMSFIISELNLSYSLASFNYWSCWLKLPGFIWPSWNLVNISYIFLTLSANSSFYAFKVRMSLSVSLSLTTALFWIFLAWSAYLKVERVYSWLSDAGEIAQIISVFELPPKAFCKIRVKQESL